MRTRHGMTCRHFVKPINSCVVAGFDARSPGALALFPNGEGSLETDRERKREAQKPQRASYANIS
jgi:hypothetical protein